VNVSVENLAPCKKLLRVEVEAQKVDEAFEKVTREFQRKTTMPGFRPGKVPREMVFRKFAVDIRERVKRDLINDSYKKAVDEQKLDVMAYPDIEEIQFNPGQPLQFAATVETAPEFELPEYKGIPVKREARSVTEEEINRALDILREKRAKYEVVERPAQTGDVAVVSYTGTCEGRPIAEIAPATKGLTEQKEFWIDTAGKTFIPGFAEQLLGARAGERRTISVTFPADFSTSQLAGKTATYEVEVSAIRQRVSPALDDALAQAYSAPNVEKLREGVRRDLENELAQTQEGVIRNQLIQSLLNRVNFELPESAVSQETKHVVFDLVQENSKRGVPRQKIEEQKEQIHSFAERNAKERIKVAFLLQKIAEKEDIKVSEAEIKQRIRALATLANTTVDKLEADLKKRNGLIEIYDQIMNEKVLQLLEQHARVEEVPPGTLSTDP
jgi:trigger factor